MKKIGLTIATLGLTAGAALAGGIDRSGQGIGYIFESGRYVELSYGQVTPSVTATPDAYGNIASTLMVDRQRRQIARRLIVVACRDT